jgi:hypothetical protein
LVHRTHLSKQPTCESTKYHNHSPPHKILASEIQVFSWYIYIYLDFLFTRNNQRCLRIAWGLRFNSFSVVVFGMWSVETVLFVTTMVWKLLKVFYILFILRNGSPYDSYNRCIRGGDLVSPLTPLFKFLPERFSHLFCFG